MKDQIYLIIVLCLSVSIQTGWSQTFTGDGTWHTAENWDSGAVPGDGSTTLINGNAIIDRDIGAANNFNPSRLVIGDNASGSLRVTGGTLSGAHGGGAGIYIGVGPTGYGELIIEEGAAMRSQGGGMRVRVGDIDGAEGRLVIAGELLNYKFFEIFNGILEMHPTGINNKFNSNDLSIIGSTGTLAFLIDGPNIGALERANTTGLNVEIEGGANLEITLTGNFEVGDNWTLMKYTSLNGFFIQDFAFTNQQGFSFDINYGSGFEDELSITLTSTADRPQINDFEASPPAITSGSTSMLSWNVGSFDTLSVSPAIGDVSSMTSNGSGDIEVQPSETTTYELALSKGGVDVIEHLTVVVDGPPIVSSLDAFPVVIAPGDSTTLQWIVDGATSVTISPEIGESASKGEAVLNPSDTTLFTLTAENEFGSSTETIEVIVDAILVARTNVYNAADSGNADGFFKDSVGINNFDLKSNIRDTETQSFRTTFTTANRMIAFTNDTGGDALGFPGGNTTFELWVRPGELDNRHQVIFETGGSSDGLGILLTQDNLRFINSVASIRTLDLLVPISEINTSDFIQIVVALDGDTGKVRLYVNGSAGGSISVSETGELATPNGRSTVFSWSSFAATISDTLGGAAGAAPEDTTQFRGEMALFNVFGRTLSAEEIQTQFDRHTVPDPEIINSFTALTDRAPSGSSVTLEWNVNDFETLQIIPNIDDVSMQTEMGVGSLDFTLEESITLTLVAVNSEGSSVASISLLADVAPDTIVLLKSGSSWDKGDIWSDDRSPQSNDDYLVIDTLAGRLNTPTSLNPTFPGKSLELRGSGSQLNMIPDFNSTVQIENLNLNGGSLIHGTEIDTIFLAGNVQITSDSQIEIAGVLKTLILNSDISGEGRLTVNMDDAVLDQTFLILSGNNNSFEGDWIFNGGRTTANAADSLGSGNISLNNAIIESHPDWNGSESVITMTGDFASLYVSADTTLRALNLIPASGIPFSVPAGSYNFDTWTALTIANPDLGLNPWIAFLGDLTVEVLNEIPVEFPAPTFAGQGNWNDQLLWSNCFPGDNDYALVNGVVTISEDIATANNLNPGRIFIGKGTKGTLIVTGGTLSGTHGGAGSGLYLGVDEGGTGVIEIQKGAVLRSQGGGTLVRIGDREGGSGRLVVGGELLNFKFFELINGSLIMMPGGFNRSFNSSDLSIIGASGNLEFIIDGDQVGSLLRANDSGLNLEINPAANLVITLSGSLSEGQSWILVDYTTLTGQFAQQTRYTNAQGHELGIDYGTGENSQVTLTLTKKSNDTPMATSIRIEITEDRILLHFEGNLMGAEQVDGPYTSIEGAISPMTITPDQTQRFFMTQATPNL